MASMGRKSVNDWIAGACGGAAGLVVGFPMDTTKVQLQTQQGSHEKIRLIGIFKKIRKDGMFSGFFRGLSMPLYYNAVQFSIYFGMYGHVLEEMVKWRNSTKLVYSDHMVASYVGGVSSLIVRCPVDIIKCTLQTQAGNRYLVEKGSRLYYRGSFSCLKDIYRARGLRGLYRGLGINIIMQVPVSITYMPGFIFLSGLIGVYTPLPPHGIIAGCLAGGVAGATMWAAIIPIDVTRTRLISDSFGTKYHGILDCVQKTYREGGFNIFFRGLVLSVTRGFLMNAAILSVYAKVLITLNGISNRHGVAASELNQT